MSSLATVSIEEELKKNPELNVSDIVHLRKWCKSQPHLPNISDSELIIFLHSNYYCMESAKANIDSFYTFKTHAPEFFADRDPVGNKDFRKTFQIVSALPLKQLTQEGYHILLIRIQDPDTTNFIFNNCIKFILIVLELWLYMTGTMKGHVLLVDVQHVSMRHTTRIGLTSMKNFLSFLQEGLPVRLKGMHFINTSYVMSVILRMMKPFMKKELTEVLHTHSTLESMEKYIPIEVLPNELGGRAGPLLELHEAEIKKIEVHRNWFLEKQLRAQVDESKRLKRKHSNDKLFQ